MRTLLWIISILVIGLLVYYFFFYNSTPVTSTPTAPVVLHDTQGNVISVTAVSTPVNTVPTGITAGIKAQMSSGPPV